jgi:hypothetical protein
MSNFEFCRGRSEDLCVKSVEHWLHTARVTQSGDAQNGVDFFQWPLSLPGVRAVFTLPPFVFSVEPVASKFQTQVLMAWADGTARLRRIPNSR